MEKVGLKERLKTSKKMSLVLDYLLNGGELTVSGITYVWLDNHVVMEREKADGTVECLGINGLAIKAQSYDTVTKETGVHYMGQQHMTLVGFMEMLEELTEEDWLGITATNALRSMVPNRD